MAVPFRHLLSFEDLRINLFRVGSQIVDILEYDKYHNFPVTKYPSINELVSRDRDWHRSRLEKNGIVGVRPRGDTTLDDFQWNLGAIEYLVDLLGVKILRIYTRIVGSTFLPPEEDGLDEFLGSIARPEIDEDMLVAIPDMVKQDDYVYYRVLPGGYIRLNPGTPDTYSYNIERDCDA